jgi:hypothetical protein
MFAQMLILFVSLTYLGLQAVQTVHNQAAQPAAVVNSVKVQATNFLLYKDALQNYAESNPGVTGTIAVSSLNLPNGITLPPNVGNKISAVAGGEAIEAWYKPNGQVPSSQAPVTGTNAMLDGTVGYAIGSSFYPYNAASQGGAVSQLPTSPPGSGYIVFYDTQSGNGA